jgi:hypothetical protein
MIRLFLRVMLGVAVAALLLAPSPDVRAQDRKAWDFCARACGECALECATGSRQCFDKVEAGEKAFGNPARLCQDCADVCALTSKMLARRGPTWQVMCGSCAEVCASCAAQCSKFPDHEQMRKCTRACQQCARTCRGLLAAARN